MPRLARNRRDRRCSRVIIRVFKILEIIILFLALLWNIEIFDGSGEDSKLKTGELKLWSVSGESVRKKKGDAKPKTPPTKNYVIILPRFSTTGDSQSLDKIQNRPDPAKAQFERP